MKTWIRQLVILTKREFERPLNKWTRILWRYMVPVMAVIWLAAFILKESPVEPYSVSAIGHIQSTKSILDLTVIDPEIKKMEAEPFYFTYIRSVTIENRLDQLFYYFKKSIGILKSPKEDHVKNSESAIITVGDQNRYSKFVTTESQKYILINALAISRKYQSQAQYVHRPAIASVFEKMTNSRSFKEGDFVLSVNEHPINSAKEFMNEAKKNIVGDNEVLMLKIKRDGQTLDVPLTLIEMQFGFSLIDSIDLETNLNIDKAIQVKKIDGDSAGLMLSLQIYQEINDINLTQGHRIAGTGAIKHDGSIEEIGSIDLKIATAYRDGAEYFLVPRLDETGKTEARLKKGTLNEEEAVIANRALGNPLKLLFVSSISDAVNQLRELPDL